RLLLFAEEDLETVRRAQVTFRTVNDIAHHVRLASRTAAGDNARLAVRHPVADLEDQHLPLAALIEFEIRGHRIGRLLVAIEHKGTTDSADLGRVFHAEQPARRIDLVYALIAEVAVSIVPEPVEIVVEPVARELALRRRPQPQIVIYASGHGFDRSPAYGVAPLIAEATRHVHVANHTFPDLLYGFLHHG